VPTFDPDVERLIEAGRKANAPPFEALSPEQARAAYAASWDILQPNAEEVASQRDVTIPGKGGELRLRIYRGLDTRADEKLPCLLFLHGGGWVIGNLDSHDRLCRRFANIAEICIVAVDYRLAPEHPFPAALDDSVTALQWVHNNAASLSILPGRSGNLAAVLALMGRDGTVPPAIYQALVYPVVDLSTTDTESYRTVSGVPLTAPTMDYFIQHYTPRASDRLDWRASPLKAKSLAGAPPALVMTVTHDPLCDEGRAYARRLEQDGVRVTSLHMSDHMHGMLMHGKLVRASNIIVDFIGAVIRDALHYGSVPGKG
jgi:acetyl esterase/lipase